MNSITGKIIELLNQRIGLEVESVGNSAIDHAVRARMTVLGAGSTEDYWHRLNSDAGEIQCLVETVIVPETWFFRHAETFENMVAFVMTEWSAAHFHQHLNILSIPCSTGEEPYSIAMALLEAGIAPGRLNIDAVDVSRRSLQHAQAGLYRPYSFRNQDQSLRDRYFTQVDGSYQLGKSIRAAVQFRQGNALDLGPLAAPGKYDVIFCRNLLIYLDRKSQEKVVANLVACLSEGGRLFTSPAEHGFFAGNGFQSIGPPGASAFSKAKPGAARLAGTAIRPKAVAKSINPASAPNAAGPTVRVSKPAVAVASPTPPLERIDPLDRVAELADAGQLYEAAVLCEKCIATSGESIRSLYLLGLIQDSLQHHLLAEKLYRKVLYLDPNHVDALLHLALLRRAANDEAQAKQLRERARRAQERDR